MSKRCVERRKLDNWESLLAAAKRVALHGNCLIKRYKCKHAVKALALLDEAIEREEAVIREAEIEAKTCCDNCGGFGMGTNLYGDPMECSVCGGSGKKPPKVSRRSRGVSL